MTRPIEKKPKIFPGEKTPRKKFARGKGPDPLSAVFDNSMESNTINTAVRGQFAINGAANNLGVSDGLPGASELVKGRAVVMSAHVCIALAVLFFIIAFIWAIYANYKNGCDDTCDGDHDKRSRLFWPGVLFVLALAFAILAIYLKL